MAGRQVGAPVRRSKAAPCHSQAMVHAAASTSPRESGNSRCEQLSAKAYTSPSTAASAIRTPPASTPSAPPSGSSESRAAFTKGMGGSAAPRQLPLHRAQQLAPDALQRELVQHL